MAERTFTMQEFEVALREYERQRDEVAENLRLLDEQRAQTVKTLDLLHGAIVALDTLRNSPAPTWPPQQPPETDTGA